MALSEQQVIPWNNNNKIKFHFHGEKKFYKYRVFHMDAMNFKEFLLLHFWCQAFFPIIFMVENVYVPIFWCLESQQQCCVYDLTSADVGPQARNSWIKNPNLSYESSPYNYSYVWNKKFFLKYFLFQISKCTHFPP